MNSNVAHFLTFYEPFNFQGSNPNNVLVGGLKGGRAAVKQRLNDKSAKNASFFLYVLPKGAAKMNFINGQTIKGG